MGATTNKQTKMKQTNKQTKTPASVSIELKNYGNKEQQKAEKQSGK